MNAVVRLAAGAAWFALFGINANAQGGRAPAELALAGQVSSAEEGPMEGVVVSAKKDGSTISVSVVTDAQGRFAFPAARLEPGHYTLKARAAGYELDGSQGCGRSPRVRQAKADIKLKKVQNLVRAAHQCRVDVEHAGHGRAEAVPAQLQRLPHARAHHEVDVRRRRLPADLPAHEPATIPAARR